MSEKDIKSLEHTKYRPGTEGMGGTSGGGSLHGAGAAAPDGLFGGQEAYPNRPAHRNALSA